MSAGLDMRVQPGIPTLGKHQVHRVLQVCQVASRANCVTLQHSMVTLREFDSYCGNSRGIVVGLIDHRRWFSVVLLIVLPQVGSVGG